MTLLNRFFISLLFITFLHVPVSSADESMEQYQQLQPQTHPPVKTYGANVQDKALHGIANIGTGWLEIPKSIINTTNSTGGNVAYGFVGGGLKGVLETLARMGSGVVDLVTAPFPTKPIAQPQYIWENFDQDTTYGPVFRKKESKSKNNPQYMPASP